MLFHTTLCPVRQILHLFYLVFYFFYFLVSSLFAFQSVAQMRRFVEPEVVGIPMGPQSKLVYACGICSKNLGNRKSVSCDICGFWSYIGCEGISAYNYSKMIKLSDKDNLSHICKICREEIFPFQKLSENGF